MMNITIYTDDVEKVQDAVRDILTIARAIDRAVYSINQSDDKEWLSPGARPTYCVTAVLATKTELLKLSKRYSLGVYDDLPF